LQATKGYQGANKSLYHAPRVISASSDWQRATLFLLYFGLRSN